MADVSATVEPDTPDTTGIYSGRGRDADATIA